MTLAPCVLMSRPLDKKSGAYRNVSGTIRVLALAAMTTKPFLNSSAGFPRLGTDRVPCGNKPTQIPLPSRSADCSRHCCIVPFLPRLIMMPPHNAVIAPNPGIHLYTERRVMVSAGARARQHQAPRRAHGLWACDGLT